MNYRVSVLLGVLFGVALLWALAPVILAHAVPLYTLQNVDPRSDGAIPSVTMFAEFGAASLLPPLAMVGAVPLCAGLGLFALGWAAARRGSP